MSYHLNFLSNAKDGPPTLHSLVNSFQSIPEYERQVESGLSTVSFIFALENGGRCELHYNETNLWVERFREDDIDFLVDIAEQIDCYLIGDEGERITKEGEVVEAVRTGTPAFILLFRRYWLSAVILSLFFLVSFFIS